MNPVANVSTQVGDIVRPPQQQRDQGLQASQARLSEATDADPAREAPNAEQLRAAAARLQQVVEAGSGRQLDFTVNEKLRELVVKVSDRKTGEVIREIPSKEVLRLREQLDDLIGALFDETV